MLQLVNPSLRDIASSAVEIFKTRRRIVALAKRDERAGSALAVKYFLTPPTSSRGEPTVKRVEADALKYFGWSRAQCFAQRGRLQHLLDRSERRVIQAPEGEQLVVRSWQPTERRSKSAVLLNHGWEGYGASMLMYVESLLNEGLVVYALDHFAHGESSGTESGLSRFVDAINLALDHLPDVDMLLGHSLGGAAVGYVAAQKPDRIRKLVLLAPFSDVKSLIRLWASLHALPATVGKGMVPYLESLSDIRFESLVPSALAPRWTMPTLILHDPRDRVAPVRSSVQLATHGPNVELNCKINSGHLKLLVDPVAIARTTEFLAQSIRVAKPTVAWGFDAGDHLAIEDLN